ncbi:MAG: hypothetical protein ACMG6S_17055 [Byssovorax sp.]
MSKNYWWHSGYIEDPEGEWKVEWTEDGWHKMKGQVRFHVGGSWGMGKKYVNGTPVWGVTVPDLSTLTFNPEFDISYEIWSSNVIAGVGLTQKNGHPITLYAALYNPARARIAEYKSVESSRGPSLRERVSCGVQIAPDSGVYVIEWSVARNEDTGTRDRQSSGSVEGRFEWDSNSDVYRQTLSGIHNI